MALAIIDKSIIAVVFPEEQGSSLAAPFSYRQAFQFKGFHPRVRQPSKTTTNMARLNCQCGEKRECSNQRKKSVMSISALLNDSESDPEEPPCATTDWAQWPPPYRSPQPIRSRTHRYYQSSEPYSTAALSRPRAMSSSTQSSEGTAPYLRRANRPKYSDEEKAFIWFHRVDLAQEWDAVVRAFNTRFRPSHPRRKSGLECKLYRVLSDYGVPQIREWRKRGNRLVHEVTGYYNYGIIEWTNIRYLWMGQLYSDPPAWQ